MATQQLQLQLQAQAVHRRSRHAAGSRTIAKTLGVSRWRARKLMKAGQLVSKQPGPRKFRLAHAEAEAVPNQLNRAFQPAMPNQVWCGDITYVRVAGRWAYVAVVLDLYARRVVGWNVSTSPDTTLVTQALGRAVATRQPEAGLLFHSDQGGQYRSRRYQQYLKHHQISQSMSRKGNGWDNAPMERLFRSLKTEWIPRQGYRLLQEMVHDVGAYLMGYYNQERVHSYNEYVSPEMQEQRWQSPKPVSTNTCPLHLGSFPHHSMRRSHILFLFLFLFPLPLLGVWLSGEAILPFLEFPPRPKQVTQAETSQVLFITCAILLIIACSPFLLRLFRFPQIECPTSAKYPFPLWGWIAMTSLLFFWVMAWTRFTWFESFQLHTFTPLWLSYIASISAITHKRIGHCLFLNQPRSFFYLFPLSAGFWWVFEYLNRFVQNWFYQPLGEFGGLSYFFIGSLCFSTVLPAIYATYELLMTSQRLTAPFRAWKTLNIQHINGVGWSFFVFAGAGLVSIGLWPAIFYPLLWIAPLFMLIGIQVLQGGDTIRLALQKGDWRPIITPALAGLICGFFWELWNSQSLAHWEYSIPYLQTLHIFEMPLLGYAGYIPFGMECILFIHLVLPNHLRNQQAEYAPPTNRPEA